MLPVSTTIAIASRIVVLTVLVVLYFGNLAIGQASEIRPRLYKNGHFNIKIFTTTTNRNGELKLSSAVGTEAIKSTVEEVNKRTDILSNVRLGYEIVNDMNNLHYIMKQAVGIVSKYRPHSTCQSAEEFCTKDQDSEPLLDRRISAVIGPATSSSSVPMASLLGLYSIPQISYAASSSVLSDKSRFKSFLRTIPSDNYQAQAMASLVKTFGWNYVFFIASDDEYGRQGLTSFKTAARSLKVCTAVDINIPFQNESKAQKQIAEIVRKLKAETRVRVVVLFMFESQVAQVLQQADKEGIENVTWILSDAIGPNIANYNINKQLLHGAFGIDFLNHEIPAFEKHLRNMTVERARENPWMLKVFEKTMNCSSTPSQSKRQCEENKTLDLDSLNLSSRWSTLINMVNSVWTIAYGLDNLMKCKDGEGLANKTCPNTSLPLNGKDLYLYFSKANFIGAINENVSFDDKGDLETKTYTFRNLIFNRERDALEFPVVATWSSLSPEAPRFSNTSAARENKYGLTWNNGEIPKAVCSEQCQPGYKQVGESDCCWACHPCPKGEISNMTRARACYKCPTGTYANKRQTECKKIKIDYVDSGDAFAIVIIVISSLGLVAMVAVGALFYYVKETPLIQDSNPILLGLIVIATASAFVFSIFHVSLYRTDSSCRFLGAFILFVVLLLSSTLLAKTKTCDSYLQKLASHFFKPAAEYSSLILIGALMLFQLLLTGIWFLTDTPVVHFHKDSQALHIRQCSSSWPAGQFIACGFALLVLFFATSFAFKERNNRKNHSEAKYISFCTISICILLIAFFPTYRFAQGMTTSVVIASTALVGGLAVCACVILPKVYILLVKPECNIPEEERHTPVSSAHTAGSHHQPEVFSSAETADERRAPTDVDFMRPRSAASQENHVVNDISGV